VSSMLCSVRRSSGDLILLLFMHDQSCLTQAGVGPVMCDVR
jgi:hypothetical protein